MLGAWFGSADPVQAGDAVHLGYFFYKLFVESDSSYQMQFPDVSLTYNGHQALTGGNTIAMTDLRSVTHVDTAEIKRLGPGQVQLSATVALDFGTSGNREVFPFFTSGDMSLIGAGEPDPPPVSPTWVVGSNLWDADLRPAGIYNDRAPKFNRRLSAIDLVWEYDTGTFLTQAIGLGRGNTLSNVIKIGDSVPLRANPPTPAPGTTFTSLSGPAIDDNYVTFTGSGTGFTGVYSKRLSDGKLSTIAENFFTNQFGTISFAALYGNDKVLFSGQQIFKADADGATPPVPLLQAPVEYEPGKFFNGGRIHDVDGSVLAVEAREAGKTAIFTLDVETLDVTSIVKDGMPIPGTPGGTFSIVQRPVVSDSLVVFEGFDQNSVYAGLFGWFNGARFPIVRIGQTLDGKTVKFVDFQPGALDGEVMGFAVHFMDNSYAAYLAAFLPDIRIDSIAKAANGDIVLEGTGVPGSAQKVLMGENLEGGFTLAGSVPVDENGKFTFTDSDADNAAKRFYSLLLSRAP